MRTPLAISLGATAGALSRYYLSTWLAEILGTEFPYSTLIINVSGCFVMGFFVTVSLGRVVAIHPDVRLLVTVGFLGSYTTFSTYELDTARLLERSWNTDLLYWSGSALLGLLSLRLGVFLVEVVLIKGRHDELD